MTNRERALDAAVELLGTGGARALTHTRVDAHAGLPKGSTSNYFRTRAALLEGVVRHMVEAESPMAAEAVVAPDSAEEFVDELVRTFDFLTGPNRTMTTARMVLLVEASHDPALRAALAQGRATFERLVIPALVRLGAADPKTAADAIAACFEGLYLHCIGRHAEPDARAVFELVVRSVLTQPSDNT
ncbi:TetR/AcrR family transcriptional regulator [Amycolatopsis jejuensis]|uniref:TetR/AcrR family transcriptional regulator n=1 Tax=Amycolatopsis jejuensis TaxID=330084 RepID=UPI00052507C6|nr:TetR family transcriptional regulator C-terminal domain-containing protein [Amycolatopsis jejuensis]